MPTAYAIRYSDAVGMTETLVVVLDCDPRAWGSGGRSSAALLNALLFFAQAFMTASHNQVRRANKYAMSLH